MTSNEEAPKNGSVAKKFRYRASYQKLGQSTAITHLELTRNLRQAFADAGIPVSYSGKVRPQPQISFGPALPVSVGSREEFVDFLTNRYIATEEFLQRMNEILPAGLHFLQAIPISRRALSLCAVINGADYSVSHHDSFLSSVHSVIKDFHLKDVILVTKHKNEKILNAKDFIRSIELDENRKQLLVEMKIIGGVTVSINEVIKVLTGAPEELPVQRERLYIWNDGKKQSPLTAEWEQIQLQKHLMNLTM